MYFIYFFIKAIITELSPLGKGFSLIKNENPNCFSLKQSYALFFAAPMIKSTGSTKPQKSEKTFDAPKLE